MWAGQALWDSQQDRELMKLYLCLLLMLNLLMQVWSCGEGFSALCASLQEFTVDLVCVNFTVHHPVRLEHHISGQRPRRFLVWVQNGFTRNPKTQQHDGHNYHDVEHVGHLWTIREQGCNLIINIVISRLQNCLDIIMVTWWYETIGLMGKKFLKYICFGLSCFGTVSVKRTQTESTIWLNLFIKCVCVACFNAKRTLRSCDQLVIMWHWRLE